MIESHAHGCCSPYASSQGEDAYMPIKHIGSDATRHEDMFYMPELHITPGPPTSWHH